MVPIRINDKYDLKHCSIIYSIIELPLSRIDGFHESIHDLLVNSFILLDPGCVETSYRSLIVTDSLGRLQ
ncbi:unnamed protein product [Rotaria sp. Silwood2]|nr:unnamed protein product [Rotaria sp. Silwood2]CAF4391097.1 unnamed protein product [Rotaria sp. Silwood2]